MSKIHVHGDYLIVAPALEGRIMDYTERDCLFQNILNFVRNHPDINPNDITIYELRIINDKRSVLGYEDK